MAMKTSWRTAWQGQEIVVYREEQAVDRVHAQDIARVVFVHQGVGDSPGDLLYAIVETTDPKALYALVTQWGDLLKLETTPCLEDAEAGAVLQTLKK